MAKVFSTHTLHPAVTELLEARADYRVASSPTPEAILNEGPACDVLIVRAPIPPEFFDRAQKLRAAVRHGAGLDMIPVDKATKAGVLVANVPGANATTVAEHVIFASIALLRRYRKMDHDLRENGWMAGRAHADLGHDLGGRTLGIVGFGSIGQAIYQAARSGFQLPVIAHTRTPSVLPEDVESVSMDRLVTQSDIVVLSCPLTEETTGLINHHRIAAMRRSTLLINVSRGPVVDEAALIEALRENRIGGAALDVFGQQPLPPDHPLFRMNNVILTPHMAGITEESMVRMGSIAAREAIRVLDGQLPENLCNPEVVQRYHERFPEKLG